MILSHLNCSFAVRGGGHTSWAGGMSLVLFRKESLTNDVLAANIEDGITIDLSSMKAVNVAADHSSVLIGAGARWEDVYKRLEPLGLAVAGGRAAPVGVSGLTLGGRAYPFYLRSQMTNVTSGGKSFFSSKVGFACDNVKSFQVYTLHRTHVRSTHTPSW